jgi:hypothetical protein
MSQISFLAIDGSGNTLEGSECASDLCIPYNGKLIGVEIDIYFFDPLPWILFAFLIIPLLQTNYGESKSAIRIKIGIFHAKIHTGDN